MDSTKRPKTRNMSNTFNLVNHIDFVFLAGEPSNYKQAIESDEKDKWVTAMQDEYDSLIKNDTWSLVDRPRDHNIVDNHWVYKINSGSFYIDSNNFGNCIQ